MWCSFAIKQFKGPDLTKLKLTQMLSFVLPNIVEVDVSLVFFLTLFKKALQTMPKKQKPPLPCSGFTPRERSGEAGRLGFPISPSSLSLFSSEYSLSSWKNVARLVFFGFDRIGWVFLFGNSRCVVILLNLGSNCCGFFFAFSVVGSSAMKSFLASAFLRVVFS